MDRTNARNPYLSKANLRTLLEVGMVSTKLGLTSFGGPIAHLVYFQNEYIKKRKWMDERAYAELVALCQFLPGPSSSQVGMGIGIIRAGITGGAIAWLGFTLPSVIALLLFALLLQGFDIGNAGWVHGLKIVAVSIVAQGVYGMGKTLTPDRNRASIAIGTMVLTLLLPAALSQVMLIVFAALIGILLYRHKEAPAASELVIPVNKGVAAGCLILFLGLLAGLPLLNRLTDNPWLAIADSFYRSGALVFGGGHVVLPLLEKEVVPAGWISKQDFLAGYGAAQAVPGPLFTFATYLGAMIRGVWGAVLATIAIFLPAFLLIVGALPFWNRIRGSANMRGALTGVNAAVVGILLAALYNPIWTSAILSTEDFVLAVVLFGMLVFWKLPPWLIVIAGIVGGSLISYIQ
ncbi:chromate transporter [Paenibacillus rhizovicinus]|uniref:Chromate transporter n=1 Tax=Paenibacillus rhizovicinus TaxID=2704463 RepID=A0A6C0PB29_9BACL|nr:chromate transporter [Paenibacillus rhizovicinus]QHW34863.1 chromate transporter [Paenibacillus rhizovicinus]